MKNILYKKILFVIGILLLNACDDDFLTEAPRSFLSPETAYSTDDGLASGAGGLYDEFVINFFQHSPRFIAFWAAVNGATDFNIQGAARRNNELHQLNSELNGQTVDADLQHSWSHFYRLVNNATNILDFSEAHEWSNENLRNRTEGEARFFRAWGHFFLTMLWGDVPLIKESVTGVKVDFTRTPQSEVLAFVVEDLTAAADLLPSIPDDPGRIVRGTAMHMLAYAYLAQEDWVNAETWAQALIDDPNHSLVTERFGTKADDPKGDPFWDLFQLDNHNNNPEALMVIQNGNAEANPLYAGWANAGGTFQVLCIPRDLGTRYERIAELFPHIKYGGRRNGLNQPTMSWLELFESQDVRRNTANVHQVFVALTSTTNANEGDTIYVYGDPNKGIYPQDHVNLRPYPTKWDWEGVQAAGLTYGTTIRDAYVIRLAETYLILAEAQLMQGKNQEAADNINAVRARAGASMVAPGDVTIDFILDEKARELWGEQYSRKVDLFRTGKYVERVKRYNPDAGANVQEFHTLLPIPQSEIDLNTGAEFSQNQGYN